MRSEQEIRLLGDGEVRLFIGVTSPGREWLSRRLISLLKGKLLKNSYFQNDIYRHAVCIHSWYGLGVRTI